MRRETDRDMTVSVAFEIFVRLEIPAQKPINIVSLSVQFLLEKERKDDPQMFI